MQYSIDIRNQRMNIVKEHINGGAVQIYTDDYKRLLVEIPLADPCGDVKSGVLRLDRLPLSGVAIAEGKAGICRIIKNDINATIAIDGLSVGQDVANIVIDGIDIVIGQTVRITSGVIIHG